MAAACRQSRSPASGRAGPLLLALGVLAGCQPLPHPFADNAPKPGAAILQLRDSISVWVAPIAGKPRATADRLAPAVAKVLQKRQIVASNHTAAVDSETLKGRIQEMPDPTGQAAMVVSWQLTSAKGRLLGARTARVLAAAGDWQAGKPDAVAKLAAESADQLASLFGSGAPQPPPAVKIQPIGVQIGPITGAPGNGNDALSRAIASALTEPDLAILTGNAGKPDLVLDAAITVGKPEAGKQHVKIVWHVHRPNGKEIGQVALANDVPAGLLDRPWGNLAYMIAAAAKDGILQLIARGAPHPARPVQSGVQSGAKSGAKS